MNEQPSTADVPEQVIDSVDGWLLSSNELELTQHKVAQINARAAKRGFTGELKVVAEPEDFAQTIAGHRVITHGFRTTITGTAPCYEGWRFLDAMEHYGNRRPRVERLVSAWAQGPGSSGEPDSEPDDPLIGAAAEPRGRPRTRLTDEEVDAMRTARANGVSVAALAKQFGVHRGTVWTTTRIKSP